MFPVPPVSYIHAKHFGEYSLNIVEPFFDNNACYVI